MKKLIACLLLLTLHWSLYAEESKLQINLDIVSLELQRQHDHMMYGSYAAKEKINKIDDLIWSMSDTRIVRLYNKLQEVKLKQRLYRKHKTLLDVLEYMTMKSLIPRHIEKDYVFSDDSWTHYQNSEHGLSLYYRTNHWSGDKRSVIEKDGLLHIPSRTKTPQYFLDKLNTEDNYTLSKSYPVTYLVEANIKNDTDILNTLSKVYGDTCQVLKKKATEQAWLFEVYLYQHQDGRHSCETGVFEKILYNEKTQTLATWHESKGNICSLDTDVECMLLARWVRLK